MKQTYLLDTNVILRLILKDNLEQYQQIIKLLEQSESGKLKLYCSSISIFETAFVLLGPTYKTEKTETIKILETVLNLKPIDFEKEEVLFESLNIFSASPVSLVDSYLLAQSKMNNYQFFSFDTKANKVFDGIVK